MPRRPVLKPREVIAGFEPDPSARAQPIQLRSGNDLSNPLACHDGVSFGNSIGLEVLFIGIHMLVQRTPLRVGIPVGLGID